jgi:hypothetical protein
MSDSWKGKGRRGKNSGKRARRRSDQAWLTGWIYRRLNTAVELDLDELGRLSPGVEHLVEKVGGLVGFPRVEIAVREARLRLEGRR